MTGIKLDLSYEQAEDITVATLEDCYKEIVEHSFPYPDDADVETLINIENMLKYFIPDSVYDVKMKLMKGVKISEVDQAIKEFKEDM